MREGLHGAFGAGAGHAQCGDMALIGMIVQHTEQHVFLIWGF